MHPTGLDESGQSHSSTLCRGPSDRRELAPRQRQTAQATGPFHLVGIVASTGGPAALQKLLCGLDPRFPLPIALVQHISDGFLESFVSWLDGACPFRVVIPREGEMPQPGTVYVAPAGRHLCVDTRRLAPRRRRSCQFSASLRNGLVSLQAQSLRSGAGGVAYRHGRRRSGRAERVARRGGYTISEDESTAVVFGMPGTAVRLGAVCELLPLHQISRRLEQLATASLEN